jgi:hypothetical protein
MKAMAKLDYPVLIEPLSASLRAATAVRAI